jgi:hypothetical protein
MFAMLTKKTKKTYNPKPQTMKNLLENNTPQATYGGDGMGGSVVSGMLGAFCLIKT